MLRDDALLSQRITRGEPLRVPEGPIDVAFLVSAGSNVIDMTGPWEVFQDVPRRPGFRLLTVAATAEPVRLTGGLQVGRGARVDGLPVSDESRGPYGVGDRRYHLSRGRHTGLLRSAWRATTVDPLVALRAD